MPPKRESKLVNLVKKEATPEEREEATERWFGFLEVIGRLVQHQEKLDRENAQKTSAMQPLEEQKQQHHLQPSLPTDEDAQQLNLFEVQSD